MWVSLGPNRAGPVVCLVVGVGVLLTSRYVNESSTVVLSVQYAMMWVLTSLAAPAACSVS